MSRKHGRTDNGFVMPGPNDLTPELIAERMSDIKLRDTIEFNSIAACHDYSQMLRHGAKIVARGTVVEHFGGSVLVKLRKVTEAVSYFDIRRVNGKPWRWYVGDDDVLEEEG